MFPKLKILSIRDCPNLVSFDVTGVYKGDFALECFQIRDCPGLTSFPDEGFHTPTLQINIRFTFYSHLNLMLNGLQSLRCPKHVIVDYSLDMTHVLHRKEER